jgi:hypothetical protein
VLRQRKNTSCPHPTATDPLAFLKELSPAQLERLELEALRHASLDIQIQGQLRQRGISSQTYQRERRVVALSQKISPAELAEARQLAKLWKNTPSLEKRLERYLNDNPSTQAILAKLLSNNIPRRHAIKFLEVTSDPHLGSRLSKFVPTKNEGARLAHRMRTTAEEIQAFWKSQGLFALLPHRPVALDLADRLMNEAIGFEQIQWSLIVRRFGFKAFWSQLPIAILCRKFRVPSLVRYTELSHILNTSSMVRRSFGQAALPGRRTGARALRLASTRFANRNALFISAGGLDVFVRLITITLPE